MAIDTQSKRMSIVGNGPLPTGVIDVAERMSEAGIYNGNVIGALAVARFWLGTTSADPTVAANWSATSGGAGGASVPGSADDVTFDGGGNNACTIGAATSWGSISMVVGYTATFSWSSYTITLTDGGNATFAGGGEVDNGSGTLSLTNGDFDNSAQTTWTRGTSTLTMGGVGTLTNSSSSPLWSITARASSVITLNGTLLYTLGQVQVDGTLSISAGLDARFSQGASGELIVSSTGIVTGPGTVTIYYPGANMGITSLSPSAVIDVSLLIVLNPNVAAIIASGTYDAATTVFKAVSTKTLTLSTGDYTFTGGLEFRNTGTGTLTIANNTNNPNITVQGDVIWTNTGGGTITYTKGNGTFTASGAANQSLDWAGSTVEELTIDKSAGTLTFTAAATFDAITHADGDVDYNGQTIAATGDWNASSPATMADLGLSALSAGGDLTWSGTAGSELVIRDPAAIWTLAVTGNGRFNACDVERCNAAGSASAIIAANSIDSLNNTNVTFVDVAAASGGINMGMSISI